MLTTVRRICGRIMHSQTALRSQWDKGWKNNSQFVSPSICRPTYIAQMYQIIPFLGKQKSAEVIFQRFSFPVNMLLLKWFQVIVNI